MDLSKQLLLQLLDDIKQLVAPILALGHTQTNQSHPAHLVDKLIDVVTRYEWSFLWGDLATLESLAKECNTLWIYLQGGALNEASTEVRPAIESSPFIAQLENMAKLLKLRVIDLKATAEVEGMIVIDVARKLGGYEALREDYARRNHNQHAYGEEVYYWRRALAIKTKKEYPGDPDCGDGRRP